MRTWLLVFACFLGAVSGVAQRHEITINAETPEGQLLQQIGQEEDGAKKLALMEKFAAAYPKHEGAAWVYEQMVTTGVKAGQFDKALEACDKLLAADPNDARGAHDCLKAAEAKKDPDAVKTWAARTSEVARKVTQAPKPASEDAVEEWKTSVDFAKQLDTYTEYSLYATALQTTDPAKKIELAETLEQRGQRCNRQVTRQRDGDLLRVSRRIQGVGQLVGIERDAPPHSRHPLPHDQCQVDKKQPPETEGNGGGVDVGKADPLQKGDQLRRCRLPLAIETLLEQRLLGNPEPEQEYRPQADDGDDGGTE